MKQSQEPKKLRLVKLTPAYRRQLLEMMEYLIQFHLVIQQQPQPESP